MNIIIENEVFDNQSEIVSAIEELGFTYRLVDYNNILKTNEISDTPEVSTILGSCRFLKYSKYSPEDNIVTWCDFESLQCSEYYPQLLELYKLNNNYFIKPFGDISYGYDIVPTQKVFIRPNTNDKIFDGTVVSSTDFPDWRAKMLANFCVQKSTLCVIAPFQDIQAEVRCICDKGKIVTSNIYKTKDIKYNVTKTHLDHYIDILWDLCLKSYLENIMPLYVIDLALVNHTLKVVELGSINCSNWYTKNKEDLTSILTCINKYTKD